MSDIRRIEFPTQALTCSKLYHIYNVDLTRIL